MLQTVFFMLGIFLFPFFYLRTIKKFSWEQIQEHLFPKITNYKKELIGTFQLLLLLLIFSILISVGLGLVENIGGEPINDLDKVRDIIIEDIETNWIIFIILIVSGVFLEELFFRAFLVPRIGLVLSTTIFTIAHIGYGSIAEIIGVFLLGLLLAYWYKKNNSLIQNYFGHLLYNAVAIGIYFLI